MGPLTHQTPYRYDPLTDTPREDLYERYIALRESTPVYLHPERGVWCISRFDAVLTAARDWETFSNAHGVDLDVPAGFFGKGDFLDQDPPRHDALRNAVRNRFTPRNVKVLATLIEERVDELLDGLEGRAQVDLAADFAWQLPIWVTCRLLGISTDHYDRVQLALNGLTVRSAGAAAPPEQMLESRTELHDLFRTTAEEKRDAPAEDVLTDLIASVDAGDIDMDELVGAALLLFAAGSETAASLLSNGLFLLDVHREQLAAIRNGEVPIEQAIEEMVRYEAPIQYLARTTTCPAVVEDVSIPQGARVILMYGAANRDPRRYRDPETFDVRREQKRHLGFGNGIHFCLGAPLARLEVKIAFERFFDRVSDYRVDGTARRFPSHEIRGINSLPAILEG